MDSARRFGDQGGRDTGSVSRLANVIQTQVEVTKQNTEAFVQINSGIRELREEMQELRQELNNGGLARLRRGICKDIEASQIHAVDAIKDANAEVVATLQQTQPRGLVIPRIGWLALVLFFLLMLVAMGVRVSELVPILRGG